VSRRLSKGFEQRLQEASDRLAAMDRVSIRVENGVATLPEYQLYFDDLSDTSRTRAVSTLTVVRAVRRCGVGTGRSSSPDFRRARAILSYKPARRRQIWQSRLPEYLAERTFADYQLSSIQDLVDSWEPLIGEMRRQRTEQGADELPAGHHHLVPLAAVADALGEGLWSSA
jgi:hypothetical protein